MTVLNPAWLSDVEMERIIVHWTAGSYDISSNDLDHYHFLIDREGGGHRGTNPVSGNAAEGKEGATTSHVKNFNTGSIGIAVAAMGNAIENPFDAGPWPITMDQWGGLIEALAELCLAYEIPVTPETVLMHGEVEQNCNVDQDGKWDIGHLPWTNKYTSSREVGDYMRDLVQELLEGGMEPVSIVTRATVEFTFEDGIVVAVKLV